MDAQAQFTTGRRIPLARPVQSLRPIENVHNARGRRWAQAEGLPPLRTITFDPVSPRNHDLVPVIAYGQEQQFELLREVISAEKLDRANCGLRFRIARLDGFTSYETGSDSPLMDRWYCGSTGRSRLPEALDKTPGVAITV